MKNKTFNILLNGLLLLISLSSCGQTTVNIPEEFIETNPPKVLTDEWHSLNSSDNEFSVKIIDGELKIEKVDEINKCELDISNGTLIGEDNGEWGGRLIFKPTDHKKKTIEIKNGNIKFIFSFKNKIYFIEGLAHLSYSGGAIFELDTTDNQFSVNKIIHFDDAPEAFTIYNDKWLIATHENFYVVQDFKSELIFENTFWSSLYPNSIAVIDDQNVFLGIRSGIVKLDLVSKTYKFYKNDK
jgi:hypothetical protein